MLKKINRLSKTKEFGEVKAQGKMSRSSLFGLIWMIKKPIGDIAPPSPLQGVLTQEIKVGFIVSKKISKKAVERNRIKRLLSEAVRRNLSMLPEGFRGIFLVNRNMLEKKYEEVERMVRSFRFK